MTKHILGKSYKYRGRYNRMDKIPGERVRINSDGTVSLFYYDRRKMKPLWVGCKQ
jgi:hypothetical protein